MEQWTVSGRFFRSALCGESRDRSDIFANLSLIRHVLSRENEEQLNGWEIGIRAISGWFSTAKWLRLLGT